MKRIFLLISMSWGASFGQSPILDKYIALGVESNLALKQQNLEVEKALKAIEIAKTQYFPLVNFAPSYSVAFGGRRIEIPIGDLLNPVYSTLNTLTGSTAFPQIENASEQLAPMNFHDTKIEVKLPLFNSDLKYNVLLQKNLLQSEEAKRKFLQFELIAAIEAAYYQHLQAVEAAAIFDEAEALAKKYLTLNTKLLEHEEALKDAVLTAEYELSKVQQQKSEAEKNVRVSRAYFNFLLNRGLDEGVEIDSVGFSALPVLLPQDAYTAQAHRNRPELEQLQTALNAQHTLVQMQEKNALLPNFYFGMNTGFQGFGYTFQRQAYMVGQVGMNWTLFHGGEKKLKIQQAKIGARVWTSKIEEVKKQIEMQVYRSYYEALESQKILDNKQKDITRTSTVHALVESRYKNGGALPIEVTKAQNDLQITRLAYSLEKLNSWLKYAELKKASGY
jgi:outer membrane protein